MVKCIKKNYLSKFKMHLDIRFTFQNALSKKIVRHLFNYSNVLEIYTMYRILLMKRKMFDKELNCWGIFLMWPLLIIYKINKRIIS